MFSRHPDKAKLATEVAEYFSGQKHGSHGRRINRDEARERELEILDLEDDQDLQDAALTLYHLPTTAFEQGPARC